MIKYNFDPRKENVEAAKARNECVDVMINFRTNPFMLVHTHAYWELLIMKENSAINVLDGEERVMRNRDFCLLRPENQHQVKRFNHNTSLWNYMVTISDRPYFYI